jgi:hypothetical protein
MLNKQAYIQGYTRRQASGIPQSFPQGEASMEEQGSLDPAQKAKKKAKKPKKKQSHLLRNILIASGIGLVGFGAYGAYLERKKQAKVLDDELNAVRVDARGNLVANDPQNRLLKGLPKYDPKVAKQRSRRTQRDMSAEHAMQRTADFNFKDYLEEIAGNKFDDPLSTMQGVIANPSLKQGIYNQMDPDKDPIWVAFANYVDRFKTDEELEQAIISSGLPKSIAKDFSRVLGADAKTVDEKAAALIKATTSFLARRQVSNAWGGVKGVFGNLTGIGGE